MPAPVLPSPSHLGQLSNSASTSTSNEHMSVSLNIASSNHGSAENISSSLVESTSPSSPHHNHTSIQLSPDNNVSLTTAPGIGISVVLDCTPSQSTITSQISETNVLLPIEGLTNAITNDIACSLEAREVFLRKIVFYLSSCSDDPSDIEPSGFKRALQIPA